MSLQEHHTAQRERTTTLVVDAINALREEGGRISLSSIAIKTRDLDPTGKGIAESTIHANPDAYDHYLLHCTHRKISKEPPGDHLEQIKWTRDDRRVASQYRRFEKRVLIEMLINAERRFLDMRETLYEQGDELLLVQAHADRLMAEIEEIKGHKDGGSLDALSLSQRKLLRAHGWEWLFSQIGTDEIEQHVIVRSYGDSLDFRIGTVAEISAFVNALGHKGTASCLLSPLESSEAMQQMSRELARLRVALAEAEKSIEEQQQRIGQQESMIEDLRYALAAEIMNHKGARESS
jgi:hypothetical protein